MWQEVKEAEAHRDQKAERVRAAEKMVSMYLFGVATVQLPVTQTSGDWQADLHCPSNRQCQLRMAQLSGTARCTCFCHVYVCPAWHIHHVYLQMQKQVSSSAIMYIALLAQQWFPCLVSCSQGS